MVAHNGQNPQNNCQYCIIRRADGGLDCGKWVHRLMTDNGKEVMMFRLVGSTSMDTQTQIAVGNLPEIIAVEET
jgi:hypothetical protein